MLYVYVYMFIVTPIALLVSVVLFGNRTTSILIGETASLSLTLGSIFISSVIIFFLICREIQLVEQSLSSALINVINPLLPTDEKVLVLISSPAESLTPKHPSG